jgi:malonyl-CoA/methylmalonyl-CoA synthetase
LTTSNLYGLLAARFAGTPEATCLETADGTRYRYADLEAESARFANLLRAAGLAPGDRVVAQIDKGPGAVFLYLGCLRAGLAYVPLNTAYQESEVAYFLADAEPKAAFCRAQSRAWFGAVPNLLELADAAGRPAEFRTVERAPGDLAALIYTSGTTGRSKGAMVTHGNLSSNALALHRAWGFRPGDVLLHALPVFHVHGLFVALHTALANASPIIFLEKFDAPEVIRHLPRATVFMGVPTYYVRLLAEARLDRALCAGMRLFVSGSAPLPEDTFNEFRRRTGHTILERYGMSEAGMIASNPYEGERRAGTVGPPLPGVEVRVAGDPGEIEVRGPNVFAGYWRQPEKTREEFTADGWFRTGDIGRLSADGYLSIVGRAKDLVISGGYNVYPKEVELVLDEFPGVAESAVFGVPHPDFGEAVTAAVVPKAGAALSEEALLAHVRAKLANFKAPKRVHLVAELPRNAMGKVQKAVLRGRFGGTVEPSQ